MRKPTPEQQVIDENDDHARLVAANRNQNNMTTRGWMQLSLVHILFWTVLIGLAFFLLGGS